MNSEAIVIRFVQPAGEEVRTFRMLKSMVSFHLEKLEGLATEVELWAEARHNSPVGELLRHNLDGQRRLLEGNILRTQGRDKANGNPDPEASSRALISFFEALPCYFGGSWTEKMWTFKIIWS